MNKEDFSLAQGGDMELEIRDFLGAGVGKNPRDH